MPNQNPGIEKIKKLRKRGWCTREADFRLMLKNIKRPSIIFEGDSWFAYPPKSVITLKKSNVYRHIRSWTKSKASILHIASNGDEASSMVSGKQKLEMAERLDRYKPDVLMFSGGGNDIVGRFDIYRFVKDYKAGMTAAECINKTRWNRKVQRIVLAHRELLELCEEFSPDTTIITHVYDIPFITGKHGEFLKVLKPGPWIKPFLGEGDPKEKWPGRNIPPNLHRAIIRIMFADINKRLQVIASQSNGKYIVTQTQGLINDEKYWRDELHPTRNGFKIISEKIYQELKKVLPELPDSN